MGLNERRRQKELEETVVPKREEELQGITGSEIKYDIAWETFETLTALNWLDQYIFKNINQGFAKICTDDMGKEAIAAAINTVRLVNVDKSDWYKTANVTDGILTIEWDYDDGSYFTGDMIESRLAPML